MTSLTNGLSLCLLVLWSLVTQVQGDFVEPPPDHSMLCVVEHETTLPCRYQVDPGDTLVQVTWYKVKPDGTMEPITTAHHTDGQTAFGSWSNHVRFRSNQPTVDSSLVIMNTKVSNEGKYTCLISTFPSGYFERQMSLTVHTRPITSLDLVVLTEGQDFRVAATCRSVARPTPRLSWDTDLNGRSSNRTSESGFVSSQYSLHPLRSMNGKKLDCLVWHPTQDAPLRLSKKLVVHYPPDTVIKGFSNKWFVGLEQAALRCESRGNPTPQSFTWTREGKDLPEGVIPHPTGTLEFGRPLSLSDAGIYKCEAKNEVGVGKAEMEVTVAEDMIQRGSTVGPTERGLTERGSTAGVIAGIVTTVIIILVAAILGYLYCTKKKQTKRDTATASIIWQGDEGQIFLQEISEFNDMTNMSGEEEEQRDDIIPITSPEPRKWIPVSKRWRPQLEKLVNIDDCKVTKVGSLLFVTDEEFRLAVGSDGTEVFLGLTDDGTEVAVKRMSQFFFHVLKNETDFLRLPKLKDPSIVRYVDFVEDENFGYLALQLCECSLAEYITEHSLSELERKQLAHQFVQSLRILHRQDPKILHRDIKPQNVLIDIQSKARLSDFGISRELPKGQTTLVTRVQGTKHWKAKETLDNDQFPYKRSTDIQVAGMLIYYILSGGHHPFGKGVKCEGNILDGKYNLDHVQDVVAKDLIERMINEDPKKRPKVEECFAHPLFWSNDRRVEYLRRIGKEVDNCPDDDKDLITVLDQYAEQGQFNTWKHKLSLELKMDEMKSFPENSFGLLNFIHNLHEHFAEEAAGVDLMEMFPDLFGCVYQYAQKQDWNSMATLKDMFHTEDVQ